MKFTLEPMREWHRTEVVDIFNHYITNSFAAYPERELPYGFYDQLLAMSDGYPAVVAIDTEGRVVGFGLLRPYHFASTFKRTAEISYFLAPGVTRQGIGTMMLEHFEEEAGKLGIESILASISSLNPESVAFHRKHGFEERGRLREVGVKFGKYFDVLWMQKRII